MNRDPATSRPVLLTSHRDGVARASRRPDGSWTVTRPLEGRPVLSLATHRPSGRVWAGTRDGAVFRSEDRGADWRAVTPVGYPVSALAVDPNDPGTVYAAVKPVALFVTRDAGATWRERPALSRARRWFWWSPADPPDWRAYVAAIAISPADANVLLVGIETGAVLRSEDAGASWSRHRRRADRDTHDLRFHARDGRWAYQAGGGGPAVSRDGGSSWRRPAVGLAGRYAMACAADPERPEVWYVATSPYAVWPRLWEVPVGHVAGRAHGTIYRSSGGGVWHPLGGGLPQPLDHAPYGLATDVAAAGHLYLGSADGQVWHSDDYGERWTLLPLRLGTVRRSMVLA